MGMRGAFPSASFFLIIFIAPLGQCLSQLLQVTPSLLAMQLSAIHTAVPIFVALFCSGTMGFIAPLGHTSAQAVQAVRQKPLSNDISGCMNRSMLLDGLSTLLGHFDTHNWQAVQCVVKFLSVPAPTGTMGVALSGTFLSSMMARPPSTFLFAWASSEPAVTIAPADRNSRRPLLGAVASDCFFATFPNPA
jgi:hypothetical protein